MLHQICNMISEVTDAKLKTISQTSIAEKIERKQ